jgi:hypothetical protein
VVIPTARSDCMAKKVVALGFAKRSCQICSVKVISLAYVEPLNGGRVSIAYLETSLQNEISPP